MSKPLLDNLVERDLRKLCRESASCTCTIAVGHDDPKSGRFDWKPWLRLGQVMIDKHSTEYIGTVSTLKCFLREGTDFEHDSAHLLQLTLTDFRYVSTYYHVVEFEARIYPDVEKFCVPPEGYDPLSKKGGAALCTHCKGEDKHLMVAHYIPPRTPAVRELYEQMRDCRVRIRVGPAAVLKKR